MDRPEDRRRFGRVHLNPSLRGDIDVVPVSVVEVSVTGARVAHEARLPRSGAHRLRFTWQDSRIEYDCEIVRSMLTRSGQAGAETMRYESGIRFLQPVDSSGALLRDLVSTHVLRAINEQIANARGLTPLDTEGFETPANGRYRRCELVSGTWRRVETSAADQPPVGFTIPADVDRYHVDLLCRTYELCDAAGREMTKIFAQLSVTADPSTPLRRYVP